MLLSVIPIIISSKAVSNEPSTIDYSISTRVVNIFITVLLVATFWAIHELSNMQIISLQLDLSEISTLNPRGFMWTSFQQVAIIPILIIAVIAWTYLYSSYQFKLMLGFIFGVASFGILFWIPEVPGEQHIALYFISLLFLGLSEVHIAPIIGSVATKYSNPKYLAIVFGLVFIPSRLFSIALGYIYLESDRTPSQALTIGILMMVVISAVLIVFQLLSKKGGYSKL
jgi:POT family proton-dependent oligopeptide transporter